MIPTYSQGYPPDTVRQTGRRQVPAVHQGMHGRDQQPDMLSLHYQGRPLQDAPSQRYGAPQQQQQGGMGSLLRVQIQGQGQGQNAGAAGGAEQGGQSADAQSNAAASASAAPPEMNLANVLHYLQSEWRRWERDRNEWEIERAEMRARIALLEGQRRSAENLKVDLLRRVKMLEYALRQERTKTVNTSSGAKSGIAPSRLAALQDEDRASNKDDKEGSVSEGSEGSAERAELPKLNGTHPAASAGRNSAVSFRGQDSIWSKISAVPRDPKSRARSREYLKQCLQEVTYLTSPGALNPLPPDAPISLDKGTAQSSEAGGSQPGGESSNVPERPRKALPENLPPSTFSRPSTIPEEPRESSAEPEASSSKATQPNGWEISAASRDSQPESSSGQSAGAPAPRQQRGPTPGTAESSTQDVLTAIYRPESKAAWREELRAAYETAEKTKASSQATEALGDELANLSLNTEEEAVSAGDDGADQIWAPSRVLRGHLDVVRAVDFAPGRTPILTSGGDDMTVKVWALDVASVLSSSSSHSEVDPILTLRGHTGPVLALQILASTNTIFSSSMDSTIRVWRLPSKTQDPYGPWDASWQPQVLEGHTDAVWDLCLLTGTTNEDSRDGAHKPGAPLVSASADGTVKYWVFRPDAATSSAAEEPVSSRRGSKGAWSKQANGVRKGDAVEPSKTTAGPGGSWVLESSWDFSAGEGVTPTCLAKVSSDATHVLIGLSDGSVVQWDVKAGVEKRRFSLPQGATPSTVNAALSPMMDMVVTATEDGQLHFYDTKSASSEPSHSCLGHPSAITSLALSPISPTQMFSASADCTLRLWDLEKKQSLQDLQGHRDRAGEGVTAVVAHRDLPVIASCAGDGAVRLWTK